MKIFETCWVFAFALGTAVAPSPEPRRIRAAQPQPTIEVLERGVILNRAAATTTTPDGAQATNLCGWVKGDPGRAWFCYNDGGECLINPAVSAVGCCQSNECEFFRIACFARTTVCSADCTSNPANLVCSDITAAYCATYSYPNSVTELRCEDSIVTDTDIEYTYSDFSTPIFLPRLLTGKLGTTAVGTYTSPNIATQTPNPSSSSGSATTNPSDLGKPAASSAGTTSAAASSSKSSNAGAIAGSVVGGVVALAAVGILFFCYRKKYKKVPQQEQGDAEGTTPDYSPYEVSGTQSKSVQELQGGNSEKGKVAGVTSAPQELQGNQERRVNTVIPHEMQG